MKNPERQMCAERMWLREAAGFLTLDTILVAEHQHHTIWSSKEVQCGRITAYCL